MVLGKGLSQHSKRFLLLLRVTGITCFPIAARNGFRLRVRVLVEGLELSREHLGGCLYYDAREVLTDGTAEDIIDSAMTEAKSQVYRLSKRFASLSEQVDRESACA